MPVATPPPLAPGPLGNLRFDAVAGFLVFLVAMPLCLAIAKASGFPAIAGIWTAVIGGLVCSVISNSQLTIKGPAAGLIVIVVGAVTELGGEFGAGLDDTARAAVGYRLALGIGVTAGILQILFGLIRAGRLVDIFPLTPVHGMLASIGIIVIAKQLCEVIGVPATAGASVPEIIAQFPQKFLTLNPVIAVIGFASLLLLFGLPLLVARVHWLKKVPAQLIVLIVGVTLGSEWVFDLANEHTYLFPGHFFEGDLTAFPYEVSQKYLVTIPNVREDAAAAFALPDFRGLATPVGLKYLLLFSLIGSLESLLSAKAVELIDPWRRKTSFDRDLLAVGVANTLSAAIGGMPMISEIVRSRANIDSGARTRGANFCHGLYLLAFVALFPTLIHRIPNAALGAMLVYTGSRLASPREFIRSYRVGSEQFVIFVGTVVATLATDLLKGIAVGIALQVAFHLWHGAPVTGLLRSDIDVVPEGDRLVVLVVKRAAVFSNWLGLRDAIVTQAVGREEVVVDMSQTRLVDHSVMEKLHEIETAFAAAGKQFKVIGLDAHRALSSHPRATRMGAGVDAKFAASGGRQPPVESVGSVAGRSTGD
jgi:MFS superfamily sulfate permease-like transporter